MRRVLLLLLLPIVATLPSPTAANGLPAPDLPDPQAVIDACWAVSKEDRESPVTERWRNGHLKTALCLENKIIDLLDTADVGKSFLTREQAREELKNLRFSAGRLYWMIYNDNDHCGLSCGTIWHSQHLTEVSKIYEQMICTLVRTTRVHSGQQNANGPTDKARPCPL